MFDCKASTGLNFNAKKHIKENLERKTMEEENIS